jgi:hypothetical protein
MNKRSARRRFLKGCILFCIGVCLLFALTPFTDFDFDGAPDSLVTDGLLIMLASLAAMIPVFLMTGLPAVTLAPPRPYSLLIVPPPITI